ncbi:alanine racemase [Variovorax dokdonensis]|uniref:Alanine racemase n=1 Tax=Variovorax dokdonensis TaxID=344883 RepID=A0ABT7N9X0_9BURK|nr:alanine racemase [Variovorax dokdonensis]MDM0044744.1 alanine racemase [Variovorax dokdonensis]
MSRPSKAIIDLAALRHNYATARRIHGGRVLATLKANAYGHGSVACAKALEPMADGLAVAFLEEALALRRADVSSPILILEGCFSAAELKEAHAQGCWVVVHHEAQLRALEEAAQPVRDMNVWLKLDSGMGRAGFPVEHAQAAYARLHACPQVGAVTLMSHLASADEPDKDQTARQLAAFDAATAGLPGPQSLANSAGLLAWPAARRDWARPGILLFGADPMPGGQHGLKPVMTLQSEVFAVRELRAGQSLGYGGRFVADAPCRVGLVAVGYADGYPRSVADGTPVAIDGLRSRIIGRVSMDMLTVDLTALPHAGIGSVVELWGASVSVHEVAMAAGTIAYELLCHVQRVPREHVGLDADRPATARGIRQTREDCL